MNEKTIVTERFLRFAEYAISSGRVKHSADFCRWAHISPSALNEIKRGRTHIGMELLIAAFAHAKLNPMWIFLGHGSMFLDSHEILPPPQSAVEASALNEEKFNLLKEKNELLQERVNFYQAEHGQISELRQTLQAAQAKQLELMENLFQEKQTNAQLRQEIQRLQTQQRSQDEAQALHDLIQGAPHKKVGLLDDTASKL